MDFTLRAWHINDADDLQKQANNEHIAKFMTDSFPHPYTLDNANTFIGFATKDHPLHIFAIDIDGHAIGGIGVHPKSDIERKNAELGYWLAEPYWGKGIITSAIQKMIAFAFENYDIDRLYARPFGSNKASQRVLEKSGFQLETILRSTLFKNDTFEDEYIYSIRRKDYTPN